MMKRLLKGILIIFTLACVIIAGSDDMHGKRRTSKDVKREKQANEKQITQTKKQIAANDRETGKQLDRLSSIKADIALHNDTIAELKHRLDSVNASIKKMNDSIARLEARDKALKSNYGATLRTIRSRRQGMNDLSFIFSSTSFNQAWRRIVYLKDIAKTSTKQAKQIAIAKEEMDSARSKLEELKAEHATALARQNSIQTTLRAEQASADNLVKKLKKQGKSLQRELDRRNNQAKTLARELDKIVEQEIREAEERRRKEAEEAERRRKAAEEAERKRKEDAEKAKNQGNKSKTEQAKSDKATPAKGATTPTDEKKPTATPAPQKPKFESEAEKDRRLTGSFASNKGRLLFPVAGRYTIVSNFGTNELPELTKVKIDNLGIDIEVPRGTSARAVYEGVVSSIFRLDGYNNIVIVRHGEYLTVYAGIEALAVKKGDKVSTGQQLGTLGPTDNEHSRLHFEIRHEKQKLNPSEWVK